MTLTLALASRRRAASFALAIGLLALRLAAGLLLAHHGAIATDTRLTAIACGLLAVGGGPLASQRRTLWRLARRMLARPGA